ncbi:MAG: hypothetical protein K6A74_00605 [Lachnospiraceae bacterium]|nr:hypothetical protein [Lachnospiraceae bacterium]
MGTNIKKVNFAGFGSKKQSNGIYFGVNMDFLHEGGIRFYDARNKNLLKTITFDSRLAFGNVFSVVVSGLEDKDVVYRYFCDTKEYVDPYSRRICGNEEFGKEITYNDIYSAISSFDEEKVLLNDFNPMIPYTDTVIMLTHVRGATMLDRSIRHKGTFAGLSEKIPYYKKLGITALEIMPSYEFLECVKEDPADRFLSVLNYKEDPNSAPKVNYWGFEEGFYYSVKRSYSASDDAETEFATLIKKLHENSMELIMMMYYPDGISPDLVSDSLRYYVTRFHVDGFRIMGVSLDIDRIVNDPFLKHTKLMFENVDLGRFWQDKPLKYKNLSLFTQTFADRAKSFLKGDEDQVSYISYALRENNKTYAPIRQVADYSGFSLYDCVSFNKKHNEANGEDNTDGTNYNYSWNCGAEGDTRKTLINRLRQRQAMNAMLLVLLSQGVPSLRGGDEVLSTCFGNNNPWCQDNETGWIKYKKTKASKDFFEFTKNAIAFRKRHSILHQPAELRLFDYMSCKLPDISFHGEEAFKLNQDPVSREFAILYAGDYAKQFTDSEEDSLYLIFNMHWEDRVFRLPITCKDYQWRLLFSTDGSTDLSFDEDSAKIFRENEYKAEGRSVSIFLLKKKNEETSVLKKKKVVK